MELSGETAEQTVHIVSPSSNLNKLTNSSSLKEDFNGGDGISSLSSIENTSDGESSEDLENLDVDGNFFKEKTGFDDLLMNVDGRLREIELDLSLILKSSALFMGNEEMERSPKVHQALMILEDIGRTRTRFVTF